jgi:cytochrome c biogenesis protein CcmG/thiol:disulfide interchange protein DsbE
MAKRRSLAVAAGVLLVGVGGFTWLAARATPASEIQAPSPLLYHEAPRLVGPSLWGQGSVSLAQFRGHYVLVNYFASWCSTCATEEAQVAALARGGTVGVLGVDFDDQTASARSFLAHFGAHFPVLVDASGQRALAWGVSAPPESFLVSPRGEVLARIVGPLRAREVAALVRLAEAKGYGS